MDYGKRMFDKRTLHENTVARDYAGNDIGASGKIRGTLNTLCCTKVPRETIESGEAFLRVVLLAFIAVSPSVILRHCRSWLRRKMV